MTEFPKLSDKERPAKLVKPRTFWITEEMDQRISELQRLRGERVVINWLRDCWQAALNEAWTETEEMLPAVAMAQETADLDYEY